MTPVRDKREADQEEVDQLQLILTNSKVQRLQETSFDEHDTVDLCWWTLAPPPPLVGKTQVLEQSEGPDGKRRRRELVVHERLVFEEPGKNVKVSTTHESGLPTRRAPRILVALFALARDRQDPRTPLREQVVPRRFRFRLRELREDYLYPHRDYRANQRDLMSDCAELERMSMVNIKTDYWYRRDKDDPDKSKRTEVKTHLFDLRVEDPDRVTDCEIEIEWSGELWRSINNQYTRSLKEHIPTMLRIERSFDFVLWRWLSKELQNRTIRRIYSWELSRLLGMISATRLKRPGRIASSYVESQVLPALDRLEGLDFAVRLDVRRRADGNDLFEFTKLHRASRKNEVHIDDSLTQLLALHWELFRKPAKKKRPSRFSRSDSKAAEIFLRRCGSEAQRILRIAHQLWAQRPEDKRRDAPTFRQVRVTYMEPALEKARNEPELLAEVGRKNKQIPLEGIGRCLPACSFQLYELYSTLSRVLHERQEGHEIPKRPEAEHEEAVEEMLSALMKLKVVSSDEERAELKARAERLVEQQFLSESAPRVDRERFLSAPNLGALRFDLSEVHGAALAEQILGLLTLKRRDPKRADGGFVLQVRETVLEILRDGTSESMAERLAQDVEDVESRPEVKRAAR